ncbi:hypothetical protein KFL_002210150 [Klebsormidium nitens]|uniref:Ataxin-10 domain-containing protein n=1 Tax=Klebsormidium nitens TaxID=105231 RepID=A0A1Y1I2J7_KLENI|nr:hypothetical protein KFL_002210150 [Klebsormidium nitens]|eukprot:GAQ85150.1 hypothetical protein KFL_002210150 [Klebsormidium nitens]
MAQDAALLSRLESLAASFAAADPACLLLLEEALDNLLARTKSAEGRQALAAHGAVSRLLKLVPLLGSHSPKLRNLWNDEGDQGSNSGSSQESGKSRDDAVGGFVLRPLMLLLRVLRNLCAGERANQDAFLDGGVQRLAQLSLAFGHLSWSDTDSIDVVRAAIQTLGNVAGGGERHQSAIWTACCPDAFRQLSKCPVEEIQGPLCMLLFRCCRESELRRAELCGDPPLLRSLFAAARRDQQLGLETSKADKVQRGERRGPSTSLPNGHSACTATQETSGDTLLTPASVSVPTSDEDLSFSQLPASLSGNSFTANEPPTASSARSNGERTEPGSEAPRFGGGEWLQILVDLLCLQHPLMSKVFTAVSNSGSEQQDTGCDTGVKELSLEDEVSEAKQGFTEEQAALLSVCLQALSMRTDAHESSPFLFPPSSAVSLLGLVKGAANHIAEQLAPSPSRSANGNFVRETHLQHGDSPAPASSRNGTPEPEHAETSQSRSGDTSGRTSAAASGKSTPPSWCPLPPAIPTGHPAIDVLALSLRLLSSVCAARVVELGADAMSALLGGGFVQLLLDLLRALGLPERLRVKGTASESEAQSESNESGESSETARSGSIAADPRQPSGETITSLSRGVGETAGESGQAPPVAESKPGPSSSSVPGQFPNHSPYLGYRRDVVAVLANAAHRNPRVQNAVRVGGGLLLVLQQCVVDESSPYLREWALFAVRNLCEGNERNQNEIAGLEVRGGANTAETEAMGYRVEVDTKSGRPKLVNIAADESSH